jgi:hypothetical protein
MAGLSVGLSLGLVAISPADATGPSASGLLQTSLAAAQREGSVRFVDRTTVGSEVQRIDGAISAPTASETLSGAAAPLVVELIGGIVYVDGSAQALESALQITPAQATPVAAKWISVASTDAPFQTLTGALTISATLDTFTPTGHLHLGKTTKVGTQRVTPVVGVPSGVAKGVSASVALLVSTKSTHLPVGATLVEAEGTKRLREEVVFTNWGARVGLTAPSGAVPFSSVLTG